METRNFKIIGSKSTLNLLDRRFIENRVKPYTESFARDNDFPLRAIRHIFAEED